MSFIGGRRPPKEDLDSDEADPFAVAVSAADRETLAMVRTALARKRMRLAFQPAVYAADPDIIGFYEGYIRLLDTSGRTIPAADFMPVAETQQLGREIDVAALQLALNALQRNPKIRIAVNMSARSIGYKPWTQLLRATLRNAPELAQGLILEINEKSALQVPDVLLPFMAELHAQGVTFTLDHFGAASTSLQLLAAFHFDIAKLDRAFIRNIDRQSDNPRLIRAAIAIAREFGMFVVAEAVETSEEANWLRDQGVGCMQGYLFGRPEVNPDFSRFRHGRG